MQTIKISGVEELAQIAEVGKIYEWTDEYERVFKVKVEDIKVNVTKGKVDVVLTEIWQ